MATDQSMLGSFNTGNAAALNGDLIQKLYDAEAKARVAPLEKRLEVWETENEKMGEINTKINELLETIRPFDLFSTTGNAFEQVTASTTGDSAIFDASGVGSLQEGSYNINITQLAQKDVYQSSLINSKDDLIAGAGAGSFITINGIDFSTDGKTYAELLENIKLDGTFDASIEQVSDTQSRLIIKSKEPGNANVLTITQTGVDMGLEDGANHILTAKNLNATIDGVTYDVSSNSITIDGNLKITATKLGESSISIQKDDSYIVPAIQEFADKYNELVGIITEELYAADSSIQDTSSVKSLLSDIKNMMFSNYGLEASSLFKLGFSFDKNGLLEIDAKVLGEALISDKDKVKDLFIGVAEDKGFGTLLKEHLDNLNSYDGFFSTYTSNMTSRKESLEKDKEKAIALLDTKYDTMAAQFAAYASIISQMESSFGGLKMMIEQSTASN